MGTSAKAVFICVAFVGLIACSRPNAVPTTSPLLYDETELAEAQKIAVFIPGAFSSVDVFDAAANWSKRDYALVYYRLPGMDGTSIDRDLSIEAAASEIAAFVSKHPDKPLALIGYSTGGPIALLAAERVQDGRPVSVAAISSAVEHGGGLSTLLRGARDVKSAVLHTQSLHRDQYWKRYWQSLLFGPRALHDPNFESTIDDLTSQYGRNITVPDGPMVRSHTRDLSRWNVKTAPDLDHAKVGFFIGLNDPVFSTRQTVRFRNQIGKGQIFGYPNDGHLLVLTQEDLFETVFHFIDDTA